MAHDAIPSTGSVKWFNESKGYGFITQDSGPDVFAHFKAITGSGYKTLVEGQRVEFIVTQGQKGLQADNIVVVSDGDQVERGGHHGGGRGGHQGGQYGGRQDRY